MEKILSEDYCSPEVFQLLREKGFPVGVGSWSKGFVYDGEGYVSGLVKHEDSITHQMAMKWLREVHKLFIVIEPEYFEAGRVIAYDFSVWCGDNYKHNFKDYPTYEDAVEAALKHVLENLI